MAKFDLGEQIGSIIGYALGWAFCLSIVVGFYFLGYWLAPYFGMIEHRDTFGFLAVISTIWMYEHSEAHERWTKANNN